MKSKRPNAALLTAGLLKSVGLNPATSGQTKRLALSLSRTDQWIAHPQTGKPGKIPVCRPQFIAIVTRAKVFDPPSTLKQAFAQIDIWAESPSLMFIGEAPQHRATLARLATQAKVQGGMIHDARIAAICLDHGAHELWTADRDFSRFPGLRVRNPLVGTR